MEKKYPKVSIIIPLYKKSLYFFEAVDRCLNLNYPNFEILIGIDRKTKVGFKDNRIKILKTGKISTGPAEKRDICILKASGDFIAFLDDDSYPNSNWLKRAVKILLKMKISSVCGPGLTPASDSFGQKITGAILASPFGSGPYSYRFTKGPPRFVDDYPAYNMFISKKVLSKIGGFGTRFYGGEDTALCIKIINSGEKIYYHPDIVVYHHRRRFPIEYIKQVGNVGLHRGYFAKTYPQTSLRLSYFGPTLFATGSLFFLFLAIFDRQIFLWYLLLAIISYLVIFMEGLRRNSFLLNLFLPFAIVISHLTYGIQFTKGFVFTRKLIR